MSNFIKHAINRVLDSVAARTAARLTDHIKAVAEAELLRATTATERLVAPLAKSLEQLDFKVADIDKKLDSTVADIDLKVADVAKKLTAVLMASNRIASADKGIQTLLSLAYRELLRLKLTLPAFQEIEFRCFSQNGEDGILHYIFSLIGTTNRKCAELCAGHGMECNTTNLIVNHGWTGLLFDGSAENVREGQNFFAECRDTFLRPPAFVHAWVTAENVNTLIRSNHFEGEIDLLSLDMDGIDYWIWKAIDCIRPRVVVLECRPEWGPNRSVTIPYRSDFKAELKGSWSPYLGASLPAFVKLGREKGYRLVGSTRLLFNVFFMRAGVGEAVFPEIPAAQITGSHENLEWVDPNDVWVEV